MRNHIVDNETGRTGKIVNRRGFIYTVQWANYATEYIPAYKIKAVEGKDYLEYLKGEKK